MERLDDTIRDWEKMFRGLGTKHTANFHGLRLHYNHIRGHQSLNQTLAEKAGIFIEGSNKWLSMIQNGSLFLSKLTSLKIKRKSTLTYF